MRQGGLRQALPGHVNVPSIHNKDPVYPAPPLPPFLRETFEVDSLGIPPTSPGGVVLQENKGRIDFVLACRHGLVQPVEPSYLLVLVESRQQQAVAVLEVVKQRTSW